MLREIQSRIVYIDGTLFLRVIKGFMIQKTSTGRGYRPVDDIEMRMIVVEESGIRRRDPCEGDRPARCKVLLIYYFLASRDINTCLRRLSLYHSSCHDYISKFGSHRDNSRCVNGININAQHLTKFVLE